MKLIEFILSIIYITVMPKLLKPQYHLKKELENLIRIFSINMRNGINKKINNNKPINKKII
jgi:hypothetical protein